MSFTVWKDPCKCSLHAGRTFGISMSTVHFYLNLAQSTHTRYRQVYTYITRFLSLFQKSCIGNLPSNIIRKIEFFFFYFSKKKKKCTSSVHAILYTYTYLHNLPIFHVLLFPFFYRSILLPLPHDSLLYLSLVVFMIQLVRYQEGKKRTPDRNCKLDF